jgi:uncharacterized protein (TIGR04255 family)
VPRVRHLARAPLREALIDIQLENPLGTAFAESLETRAIPYYEIKNEIRQFSINLVGTRQPAEDRVEELLGWRYESTDGSRVVQLRHNGMTYSILREYTEWADIKSATQSIWNLYRDWTGGAAVGRIAVRYINVLDLPPIVELNRYLTAAPQIPEGLPQTLTHFFERIAVPFEHDISAIITQTLEQMQSTQPSTRVVLDIDAYAQRSFLSDSDDLWNFIDRLRDVKNLIFFSSVTESTLEAYE